MKPTRLLSLLIAALCYVTLQGCTYPDDHRFLPKHTGTVTEVTDYGQNVYGRYAVSVAIPDSSARYSYTFRTDEPFATGDKVVITHAR